MRLLSSNETAHVAGAGLLGLNAAAKVALRPIATVTVKADVDLRGGRRGGGHHC